jgi:hypothetical protein
MFPRSSAKSRDVGSAAKASGLYFGQRCTKDAIDGFAALSMVL